MHRQRQRRITRITLLLALLIPGGYAVWLVQRMVDPVVPDYRLRIISPSARSLGPGASVRVAGLKVGRVTSIDRRGNNVVLGVKVKNAHTPLPADTTASIRLRSLVGETYVELFPGTSARKLPDDGVIAARQVAEETELDQVLDVLKGDTRTRARALFEGMDAAFGGRAEELNRTVGTGSAALDETTSISRLLANERPQFARLVDNLGRVMTSVGARGQSVRALAAGLNASAGAVARRDDALRDMLHELPPTLRQVRTTSKALDATTGDVAPVLADTGALLSDLKPSLQRLLPAAQEGRRVIAELGRTAPPLEGTLDRLRRLAPVTKPALPNVTRALCQIDPAVKFLAPYHNELAMVFANMGAATNFYDKTGHATRLYALVGDDTLAAYDPTTSKLVDQLIRVGTFGKLRQRGYNPYPAPGKAGKPEVGEGALGPADASKLMTYPRITAEC